MVPPERSLVQQGLLVVQTLSGLLEEGAERVEVLNLGVVDEYLEAVLGDVVLPEILLELLVVEQHLVYFKVPVLLVQL